MESSFIDTLTHTLSSSCLTRGSIRFQRQTVSVSNNLYAVSAAEILGSSPRMTKVMRMKQHAYERRRVNGK